MLLRCHEQWPLCDFLCALLPQAGGNPFSIKNKKREDVIRHIQEGQVQLFYDLIEFARLDVDDYKDMVQETLDHLVEVSHDKLPSKESVENGAYKKMICKELNKLFPRRTRLYMHFLKMKIETAEKHGVISKGTCEALDKRRFCIAP
ncbi:uncharacterized protein [Aegilops tauschii subsp. strangulata]|uniref:uncharacterized protein isoform X2 n=1 Tax=Aegilops tauschii subsp. strangulata TaxID=200361 RepID=UPI00098A52EA|nr:uncharacterized protein LOC109737050 isoform X3 [Aegilops tauschii subsp. strangulata]